MFLFNVFAYIIRISNLRPEVFEREGSIKLTNNWGQVMSTVKIVTVQRRKGKERKKEGNKTYIAYHLKVARRY